MNIFLWLTFLILIYSPFPYFKTPYRNQPSQELLEVYSFEELPLATSNPSLHFLRRYLNMLLFRTVILTVLATQAFSQQETFRPAQGCLCKIRGVKAEIFNNCKEFCTGATYFKRVIAVGASPAECLCFYDISDSQCNNNFLSMHFKCKERFDFISGHDGSGDCDEFC